MDTADHVTATGSRCVGRLLTAHKRKADEVVPDEIREFGIEENQHGIDFLASIHASHPSR